MSERRYTERRELHGMDRLTRRDHQVIQEKGKLAAEELRGRARAQEREIVERRERIEASERYIASRSEHARTMDARDKVAARIARQTGMTHTEAQSFVAENMERSRRDS